MYKIDYDEGFLIKIAPKKYAESFRKGEIFMNTLEHFRKLESDGRTRSDLFEGAHSICSKKDIDKLRGIGISFTEEEKNVIVGGITLLDISMGMYNLFCMYKLKYDKNLNKFNKIDNRLLEFGDSYVKILDFDEFKNRVNRTFHIYNKSNILQEIAGETIEYYDYNSESRYLGPFKKISSYAWQNEYRIIVSRCYPSIFPIRLNIGDISDITEFGNTIELINFENYLKERV